MNRTDGQTLAIAHGPSRDCVRCMHRAEKDPSVVVRPVEVLEGLGGRAYLSGLCRDCADIEWSERWSAKRERALAASDEAELRRLEHAKTARIAAGRKVLT